jgi:lipoate---protein ligase
VKLLDLTLPTPEENLALDEALLDEAEAAGEPTETLRLWEPPAPLVVIGRSSRIAEEVNLEYCQARGVPVLRRSSGGAAIVTGPGCLMYAVVLSNELRPQLHSIDQAHQFVLETMLDGDCPNSGPPLRSAQPLEQNGTVPLAAAIGQPRGLRAIVPDIVRRGTSDLAIGERKFSGNSLRCKRTHLLYHGTLLYDFPLELIAACLQTAPRQPAYRGGRKHDAFVANLPATGGALRSVLAAAWKATYRDAAWPAGEVDRHVRERYSRSEWHWQF